MQSHSTPGTARPCWHCDGYAGLTVSGCHARCVRGGRLHIQGAPRTGCVFWEREPGADDEPGPPAEFTGGSGANWRDTATNGWQSAASSR